MSQSLKTNLNIVYLLNNKNHLMHKSSLKVDDLYNSMYDSIKFLVKNHKIHNKILLVPWMLNDMLYRSV